MESRLLDRDTGRIVASNYDLGRKQPPTEEFQGTVDPNPGILDLEPAFTLTPGGKYLLTFSFARPDTTGILEMTGPHFYREYILPESGGSKAFGSGPDSEKSITIWTSVPGPETIKLRFIPTGKNARPADFMPFAKFRIQLINEALLPVEVESLMPYRATVISPQAAFLESPRMFVPGYEATVNGADVPVRKSSEGLVAFAVAKGHSRAVLRFVGPVALRAAFWLSAAGWLMAAFWTVWRAAWHIARRSAQRGSG
jgi:hypothetical protein